MLIICLPMFITIFFFHLFFKSFLFGFFFSLAFVELCEFFTKTLFFIIIIIILLCALSFARASGFLFL